MNNKDKEMYVDSGEVVIENFEKVSADFCCTNAHTYMETLDDSSVTSLIKKSFMIMTITMITMTQIMQI